MVTDFSFNNPKVSDKEIIEYIDKRENIVTISFISPYTSIPHMCPVWCIFHKGKFYFQSEDYNAKTKAIKKGNDKIGITFVDPNQFPDYSAGSIAYISVGGKASILTKDSSDAFAKILEITFQKYFTDEKERKRVFDFVLEKVKTRVFIEVNPDWIKVAKIPDAKD
jgi:nitroimidazol reductase NimA-like FMN-containing flavoprotein (pyridoxamine 5'-phosphate oxidase superfamily)